MDEQTPTEIIQPKIEIRKRKREIVAIFIVALLFLSLIWFEIRLFGVSQQLPFVYSIFFFGLVNFNIILLLLLLFLIFRNVVKVFVEKRSRVYGRTLRSKLITAFVGFSTIPTILLFFTSVFYINSSFDKWFSVKMGSVLKSSLEVTNAYYFNAKKKNYHFAHRVAQKIGALKNKDNIKKILDTARQEYFLDSIEYYPNVFGQRFSSISSEDSIPDIPRMGMEFLQKGFRSQAEVSTIQQFGEGNLVRVVVPVIGPHRKGMVVVSSFVPLSLISKMNDISAAYEEFRDVNPLEYPLKSIYLIILVLMTLMILFAATWFGFYLARQLSIPLVQLGNATRRIIGGEYYPVEINAGSEEIFNLVKSFNQMTMNLASSQIEVKEANNSLKQTLDQLDRHSRYVEVVLANVSAGVISVDNMGKITTINRRAGQLLKLDPNKYLGRMVRELLNNDYYRIFAELLKTMKQIQVENIQREITVQIQGEAVPLQMAFSILKDENGQELGKIIVFDDMTPIVNAQRAQAWAEVARRIAHEIKNPLTPIKLSAERLQRKFPNLMNDTVFSECTTMIILQTEGLKNLVNEFNQFARLPAAKMIVASINDTIEASLKVYQSSHPDYSIQFFPDHNVPEFKFDPDQIKRVIVNLMDNAISSMEAEDLPPDGKEIQITSHFNSTLKILRIVISDLGKGIPAGERYRIFEPYFTTKSEGTGLGLAIVRRIIEDHNGFIRAMPNQPRGTQMVIEIPVHDIKTWAKK